jgi:hypothetical protein
LRSAHAYVGKQAARKSVAIASDGGSSTNTAARKAVDPITAMALDSG